MSDVQRQRSFSVGAFALVAIATGLVTWLCIGWFGAHGPLTAAVGVMLVELFLACLGVMAVLLASRLSEAYLLDEARFPEQPARSRELWLWRPIWQPQTRWNEQADEYPHVHSPIALTPVADWLRRVHDELRPLGDLAASDTFDESPVTLQFSPAASDQSTRHSDPGDLLPHRGAA
jgi:hypothetical protein